MAKRRPTAGDDERADAIVEAALSLAIEGGFENVRQREVAARAGVTLRTLYRKFPSKDDLLAMGLVRASEELDRRIASHPIDEATAAARLTHLFSEMTSVFCGQPNFGRAVIRVLATGTLKAGSPVLAYEGRVFALVLSALRGAAESGEPTAEDGEIAKLLILVWFAGLFSWAAGIEDAGAIGTSMEIAIRHIVPRRDERAARHRADR
jgi:AcrR family transcriptional regulator